MRSQSLINELRSQLESLFLCTNTFLGICCTFLYLSVVSPCTRSATSTDLALVSTSPCSIKIAAALKVPAPARHQEGPDVSHTSACQRRALVSKVGFQTFWGYIREVNQQHTLEPFFSASGLPSGLI